MKKLSDFAKWPISLALFAFFIYFIFDLSWMCLSKSFREVLATELGILQLTYGHKVVPLSMAVVILCAIWSVCLWLIYKDQKLKRVFIILGASGLVVGIFGFPVVQSVLIHKDTAQKRNIRQADLPKLMQKADEAFNKLKGSEKLSFEDTYLALITASKFYSNELVREWSDFTLRVLSEEPVSEKPTDKIAYFRIALEAIQKSNAGIPAVKVVQEIKKVFLETKTFKTRNMYFEIIRAEESLINPPYRNLDEVDIKDPYILKSYESFIKSREEASAPDELSQLGDRLTKVGLYHEALNNYQKSLNSAFTFTDYERADPKEKIFRAQLLLGQYEEAMETFRWLTEKTDRYRRPEGKLLRNEQLSALIAYKQTGDRTKTFQFIKKYRDDLAKNEWKSSLGEANIIFMYDAVGAFDEGVRYMDGLIEEDGLRLKQRPDEYDRVKSSSDAERLTSMYKNNGDARWRAFEPLVERLQIREGFEKGKSTGRSGYATKVLMAKSDAYLSTL